ncbi:MAG TPA: Lrp/AsnC family transcriptional regulator [Candidatus Thermoplasmatota archaeon]|nr:Lrp/AsnC family transcriptional regulator [Candidatus Thermoplasmatota archaeon]
MKEMLGIMTTTMKETITADEAQVLALLERQAKESIDEIGKQCGFSRQKVWKIIKLLEERKIIWGYSAVEDGTAQNLKHFMVLLKRNSTPLDKDVKKEIILRKIDDYPEGLVKIEDIYFTHGIADWVLTFYAPDIISAKKYVDFTFERFSKYIQEYSIVETLVTVRKMGLKNPQISELIEYI